VDILRGPSQLGHEGRSTLAWLRAGAGMIFAAGSWMLFLSAGAPSASASTLNGTATLEYEGAPLDTREYPSTQRFTVVLPSGASCTGDTSHDSTHVYSYLVPEGTNLSDVTFTSFPSVGLGLVDTKGWYFSQSGADTAPGRPRGGDSSSGRPDKRLPDQDSYSGRIIGIPTNFDFASLIKHRYSKLTGTSGLLYTGTVPSASGVWETGLACVSRGGTLTDNWNTEVTFSYSSSDPNRFVWTSTPGPDSSDNGPWLPEIAWAAVLPVAGIAVLGGWLWLHNRRKTRQTRHA
jgi:hypothetical protein